MSRSGIFALLLGAAILSACTVDPINLRSDHPGNARTPLLAGACPLRLIAIDDVRPDPKSFGQIRGSPAVVNGFSDWLHGETNYWLAADNGGPDALGLRIQVLQAHLRPITTAMSTTLVMTGSFERKGANLQNTYRGNWTGSVWVDTERETRQAFDEALQQVLQAMRKDADRSCGLQAS